MEKENMLFTREKNNMLETSNDLLTSSANLFQIKLKDKCIKLEGHGNSRKLIHCHKYEQ